MRGGGASSPEWLTGFETAANGSGMSLSGGRPPSAGSSRGGGASSSAENTASLGTIVRPLAVRPRTAGFLGTTPAPPGSDSLNVGWQQGGFSSGSSTWGHHQNAQQWGGGASASGQQHPHFASSSSSGHNQIAYTGFAGGVSGASGQEHQQPTISNNLASDPYFGQGGSVQYEKVKQPNLCAKISKYLKEDFEGPLPDIGTRKEFTPKDIFTYWPPANSQYFIFVAVYSCVQFFYAFEKLIFGTK